MLLAELVQLIRYEAVIPFRVKLLAGVAQIIVTVITKEFCKTCDLFAMPFKFAYHVTSSVGCSRRCTLALSAVMAMRCDCTPH